MDNCLLERNKARSTTNKSLFQANTWQSILQTGSLPDPVQEISDLGVHSGVSGIGAAVPPGDDGHLGVGVLEDVGAAAVALAGVDAAILEVPGAEHAVEDGVELGVGVGALLVRDGGKVDLLQVEWGEAARLTEKKTVC